MAASVRKWLADSDSEHEDLCLSLGFIVGTLVASEFVRLCVKWVIKDKQNIWVQLLMELLAAGEMCATCFELGVIAENYGVAMYSYCLFGMCIWWSLFWGDASACPYTHLEDYVSGGTSLRFTIVIILIEVLGGIAAYPLYVRKFWLYKFIPKHAERIYQNRCSADLMVPAWQGAIIEGVATCICQLTGRVMARSNSKFSIILTNFVSVALVVAAFELSGGYFNPVLATALQWNCGEISRQDHFIVYWVGSIGGSLLSVLLWNHRQVHNYLIYGPPKPKVE